MDNTQDLYFYSVESDFSGEKYIHLFGNIYNTDDGTETNFRIAEWTGMFLSIPQLQAMLEDDTFYDFVNERISYIKNLTQAEAMEAAEHFYNGRRGQYQHIADVSPASADGDFWF